MQLSPFFQEEVGAWNPGALFEDPTVSQYQAPGPISNPLARPGQGGFLPTAQGAGMPVAGPQGLQPAPPQPSAIEQALGSPSGAMAGSALQNLVNTSLNQYGAQVDPIQAYQQAIQQRAILSQRDQMLALQQQQEARAADMAEAEYARKVYDMLNPKDSATKEKLGLYMQSLGLDPADPAALQDPRIAEFLKSSGNNVNVSVGGTNVNTNPLTAATGATSTASKATLRDNLTNLTGMLTLGGLYKPEYLQSSFQLAQRAKGLQARLGGGDALSPEDTTALKGYTTFKQGVERYFNAYKKMITGSAGSPEELEGIRQSIFNMDQSAPEFEAALEGLQADMARDVRGAIYLQATQGIPMGTPQMAEELNKRSAASFTGDEMKDAVGDYVMEALGFSEATLTPEQRLQVIQQLDAMGF